MHLNVRRALDRSTVERKREAPSALDKQTWLDECGSCHVAYPARALPKTAWAEIMRTLDEHFGTDATVDDPTAASVSRYLAAAGNSRVPTKAGEVELRITKTRWFQHEHDEIPTDKWMSPKVKSAANCGACHRDADQGRFSEKSVKVP